jgi:threonylcarbamoyladenosine tRNA methylthiotransferase MtaB
MPPVPVASRKERAARLRAAGAAALEAYADRFVGRRLELLVERGTAARTPHYLDATLEAAAPDGTVVTAEVTGRDGPRLLARAPT